MEKNFNSLYFRFLRIKQLGWIKSMRKGPTGVGYTFEELLNKKEDHLPLPDYKGIEIKTNMELGKEITIKNLKKQYQAIFIGIGANSSKRMNIEGENQDNVFFANELLENEKPYFQKHEHYH